MYVNDLRLTGLLEISRIAMRPAGEIADSSTACAADVAVPDRCAAAARWRATGAIADISTAAAEILVKGAVLAVVASALLRRGI